jgi:nicotinate-nucleotide adenylyltransferase
MKKILFYPGTFNPPHFGHASAVEVAAGNMDFDEVWIMPSGKRLDKVIHTSYDDRRNLGRIFVEYLQTAVAIPVKLLTNELDDVDGKHTHEVILELKSQSEHEIFQLVGIDGYMGIKERTLGPNEKFVIIKRSGYEFPEELTSNNNLTILDEEVGGISSTKIREMVKSGDKEYKKLVPEKIAAYIEEKGLYLN